MQYANKLATNMFINKYIVLTFYLMVLFSRIEWPLIHCEIPIQKPWIQFQVSYLQWQQNNGGKWDHIHKIFNCILTYLK